MTVTTKPCNDCNGHQGITNSKSAVLISIIFSNYTADWLSIIINNHTTAWLLVIINNVINHAGSQAGPYSRTAVRLQKPRRASIPNPPTFNLKYENSDLKVWIIMWYNHSSMVQLKPPHPVTIIPVWIIPWYNYSIIDSIPSPTPFRQILNLHSPQTLFLQSAIISNRQSKSRQSKSQPAALGEQAAFGKASKLRKPSLVREHYIKVGNQKAGKPSGYSNTVPSFQR